MRWWKAGIWWLTAAMVVGLAGVASAVPLPFEDSFEGVAAGGYPSATGWIPLYGKSATVTNGIARSGCQSFRLDSSWFQGRVDYVRLDRVPDAISYEASVYVDPLYGRVGLVGFVSSFTNPGPMVNAFRVDGLARRLGFYGSSYVDLAPYYSGTWCTVRADLDYRTLTADLWVNGVLVAQQVPIAPKQFYTPSLGNVALTQWGVNSSNSSTGWYATNVVHFDDVKLYERNTTIEVQVDVRPGTYPNPINRRSRGLLPVAIFSEEGFDATRINPSTVTVAGARIASRGQAGECMAHDEDVNGDGLPDLVVQVQTQMLDFEALKDGLARAAGETCDGVQFEGSDEVILVP
jgi:hypothetical protein